MRGLRLRAEAPSVESFEVEADTRLQGGACRAEGGRRRKREVHGCVALRSQEALNFAAELVPCKGNDSMKVQLTKFKKNQGIDKKKLEKFYLIQKNSCIFAAVFR